MPSVRLKCYPRNPEIVSAPIGMLLPHEMFATIWTHGTPKMHSELLGSDTTQAEYWKHCDGSEWMKRRPVSKCRDQWNSCIPIGLHGDDVQTVRTSRSTKSSHAPGTHALVPLVAIRFSCVRTIAWGLQRLMICLMLFVGQWLVFGLALGQRLTILEPNSHPATVFIMQANRLIPRVVIVEHLRKCAVT